MGVDGRRVVELVVDRADGEHRGSGFLLRTGVVITAWHVVAGAAGMRVVAEAGSDRRRSAAVVSVVRLGVTDVALLCVDGLAADVPAVAVGGFGKRAAVIKADTFGFPRFKLRDQDGSKFRELTQVGARLAPQGNWRTGRCELIVAPAAADPSGMSPWEGMSGAPVFDRASGVLVGVVTDHYHREGLSRLAASRLDLSLASLDNEQLAQVLPLLGLQSLAQVHQVWHDPGALTVAAYREVVRDIAPRDGLLDREAELAELAGFCAGDQSYVYWQAPTKAGKTALAATFALQPPAGVVVVPFFIIARLAGQSDSNAFIDAMLDQLSALLGEQIPALSMPLARHAHWRGLLARAAAHCAAGGGQLVVLVDGLDEDTGTPATTPSIARLLPSAEVTGVKVFVLGRPDPPLPPDVREVTDHPLHTCPRLELAPSIHARGLLESAELELGQLLDGEPLHADLLGLIAASGGGLTLDDLEQLTKATRRQLQRVLHSYAGRSIAALHNYRRSADTFNDHGYVFTHETLRQRADQMLGPRVLAAHRQDIHSWADHYRQLRWPADTPRYLLTGYQQLLSIVADIPRLAALAEDTHRHDRMHDLTGGDDTAYAEIQAALTHLTDDDNPNFRTIVRIARHRDHLQQRNHFIPIELPAVWAALGDIPRAKALANSIPVRIQRIRALEALAEAAAATDPAWAAQLAAGIADPDYQAWALRAVVKVVAATDPVRAQQIAKTITDEWIQGEALVAVVRVMAATDPVRADQIAATITNEYFQLVALVAVARVVAATNPARAENRHRLRCPALPCLNFDRVRGCCRWYPNLVLAEPITDQTAQFQDVEPKHAAQAANQAATDPVRAMQIAATITDRVRQAEAFVAVAKAVAATDPAHAVHIATTTITNPVYQAEALAAVARVVATTDPNHATQLAYQAERIASIPDPADRRQTLTVVAKVVAATDPARAEQIAATIPDPNGQGWVLEAVAVVVAATDPARAEQIAATISNPISQANTLEKVAVAVAATDPARAEQIAATISNRTYRAMALTAVAEVVAATDPDRATRIAAAISDEYLQSQAWTVVIDVVAATDPERAAHIAATVSDPIRQARLLELVTAVVAATDPAQAEQLPATAAEPIYHQQRLARQIKVIAATDPARAAQLAAKMTSPTDQAWALAAVANVIATTDTARAKQLAAQAAHVAATIADPERQGPALIAVVSEMAEAGPLDGKALKQLGHSVLHGGSWRAAVGLLPAPVQTAICDDLLLNLSNEPA